jgi:signal transduction histidine kinase
MEERPLKILLVEDNPGDARLIREMLSESVTVRFELTHKKYLDEALKCLAELPFDVLLLDLGLPDSQGLETVMRTLSLAPALPIIVLTGLEDDTLGIKSVEKGAQDYLVKGQLNERLLVRSIMYAFERKRAEEKLSRAHHELEQKIAERTIELTRSNEKLEQEIQERTFAEEAINLNVARLKVLLKLSEMEETTFKEIVDFVLKEQVKLTQSNLGFLGFMEDDGATINNAWSRTAMEECTVMDKPFLFPSGKGGLWAEVIRQRKPLIVNDYSAPNPHKKGYPAGHAAIQRLMILPVVNRKRVSIVAAVANKNKDYEETDLYQFRLLLDGMWKIIQRKRIEDSLKESEQQLKTLSAQLLASQETERKRIVQELHDSVGQTLSALKFTVENNIAQAGNAPEKMYVKSLADLIPKIQNAVEEVDRIGKGLRPSILDDLGILATFSWFCREFQEIYSDIRIEKEITLKEDEVPEHRKVVIYRILQESLNNIAKHSHSDHVHISFKKEDHTINLTIKDNGRGFNVETALATENQKGGLGLISMIKRAELSGGNLVIKAEEKKGTIIRASWPC